MCTCFFHILMCILCYSVLFFFFKQKTAYEMRISDWSSDVCSSDLIFREHGEGRALPHALSLHHVRGRCRPDEERQLRPSAGGLPGDSRQAAPRPDRKSVV